MESSGHQATILEVNSTDFVARNDQFQAFVREAAKIASWATADRGARTARFPGSQTTVKRAAAGTHRDHRREHDASANPEARRSKGVIATYVHNAVTEGLGKIGVLVALESDGDATALGPLGRQIAMHVAATNPVALDAAGRQGDG